MIRPFLRKRPGQNTFFVHVKNNLVTFALKSLNAPSASSSKQENVDGPPVSFVAAFEGCLPNEPGSTGKRKVVKAFEHFPAKMERTLQFSTEFLCDASHII